MRVLIKTDLNLDYKRVFGQFDSKLFDYLLPPKFVAEASRFDGSKKGDKVIIQFKFPYKTQWVSVITDDKLDEYEAMFIDEGEILPFGLKSWKHIHRVLNNGDKSQIVDDINYSHGNKLLDIIMYPFWYLSFLPRKKAYKKYFK